MVTRTVPIRDCDAAAAASLSESELIDSDPAPRDSDPAQASQICVGLQRKSASAKFQRLEVLAE